jgi:S-adenosylmethionine synthetase
MRHIFTSESVTEGHPDKMADQISDAVLDAVLTEDPTGRVACEVLVTTGICVVSGEITTNTYVDVPKLARSVIHDIGYTDAQMGFDSKTCGVLNTIQSQSPDIAMGVDTGGAGDQGLMFGYACDETEELMPLPIMMAHKLVRQLSEVRRAGKLDFLRPDGKSQVSVEYINGRPARIDAVVVSTQHDDAVSTEDLRVQVKKHIIDPVLPKNMIDSGTKYHINPTGRFHGAQDHRGHLRRHGPARRRRVLGQGSDKSGPLGVLHGPVYRKEHCGRRLGEALRSSTRLRDWRRRARIGHGQHFRHRRGG